MSKSKVNPNPNRIAFAVEISLNDKIGPVSTTYATQESCDRSCPHYDNGCYAEVGMVAIHGRKLNKAYNSQTPEEIAIEEANAIKNLTGNLDLRVHTVGDCRTPESARIVSDAMRRHRKKAGRKAWTYTHAWRKVPVENWQGESVLASVETVADAKEAMQSGYPVAIVVEEFDSTKPYIKDGIKILPCPAQVTKGKQCVSCRACMNGDSLLRTGTTIGFVPHGVQKKKVIATLQKLNIKPKVAVSCQILVSFYILPDYLFQFGNF